MQELAAHAVGTVHGLVIALAQFGLVVLGHVFLLLQFEAPVRKRTRGLELAVPRTLPVLAHLRLVLNFERFRVLHALAQRGLGRRHLGRIHLLQVVVGHGGVTVRLLKVDGFLFGLKVGGRFYRKLVLWLQLGWQSALVGLRCGRALKEGGRYGLTLGFLLQLGLHWVEFEWGHVQI